MTQNLIPLEVTRCGKEHEAVSVNVRKAYREAEVQLRSFLASALRGGELLASRPSRLTPGGRSSFTYYMRLDDPHGWSGRSNIYESHRCTVHFVKSLQLLTNKCTYITFT